jgi:SAM-dependent methyltransferase
MSVDEFLEHFIHELEVNKTLRNYYRLIDNPMSYPFRKAYLHQRLLFVDRFITLPEAAIWDIGCGYANTALFLTLNGHRVTGTTLEYYYDQLQNRLEYWSRFGNLGSLTIEYQNLFDTRYAPGSFDYIIVQDTLHHLEPIEKALRLIQNALHENGKLIVSEENGNNLFINLKNFLKRGNKRIIEYYDPKLNQVLLLGNENTRSLDGWESGLRKEGLYINPDNTEFIRLFPPGMIRKDNYAQQISREQKLWKKNRWLKKYFFFGINFTAEKKSE